MKLYRIFLLSILAAVSVSANSASIKSLEKHEAEIIACFKAKNGEDNCISQLVSPYVPPGQESLQKIALQLDPLFKQWITSDKVFEVYATKNSAIGNIIVSKEYIIEDTTSNLMLFKITYRKILGKWHIQNFDLTSQTEDLKSALGL